jgi:hypothetical protein
MDNSELIWRLVDAKKNAFEALSDRIWGMRAGRKRGLAARADAQPCAGRRRCRLHGGLSPGAPRGPKNGNIKNGDWTAETIEERRWLRSLVRAFAQKGPSS